MVLPGKNLHIGEKYAEKNVFFEDDLALPVDGMSIALLWDLEV